jgi:hypothetical protein
VRGLWNLNSLGGKTGLLAQFPTDDSLVKYLKDGGGPVSNVLIPVPYPDSRRQFWGLATMVPVEGSIDLFQIAISIYRPTKEEISKFEYAYTPGNKFIIFNRPGAEVAIEKDFIGEKSVLKFTFRRDLLTDRSFTPEDGTFTLLALNDEITPEENLLAASQLLNIWQLQTRTYWRDLKVVNFLMVAYASFPVLERLTSLDDTPLAIR